MLRRSPVLGAASLSIRNATLLNLAADHGVAQMRAAHALRAVARGARGRVISFVAIVLVAWSLVSSTAWGQVELPVGNQGDPITVAADGGRHWVEGAYDVYLLQGNCYINQGLTYARS